MSIESATQRLTGALGELEAKVTSRVEQLQSDLAQLRTERDKLHSETISLRAALAASGATAGQAGVSAAQYAQLEQRNAHYKATLARTLQNLDSLISRVESAAK